MTRASYIQQEMFKSNNVSTLNNRNNSKIISIFPKSKSLNNTTETATKKRTQIRIPVQPLKDLQDIAFVKDYLLNKTNRYSQTHLRDYTLFVLGINFARRIGDLLDITVEDVLHKNNTFKDKVYFLNSKSKIQQTNYLMPQIKEILKLYFKQHPRLLDNRKNHLFPSRQSKRNLYTGGIESMGYDNAYKIFKDIEKEINKTKNDNDKLHIATHTMRKTKATQYVFNNIEDQYALMRASKMLGHKDIATTMHYLGLDEAEIKKVFEDVL